MKRPLILDKNIVVPPTPILSGDDGNGVFSFIYRGDEVRLIEKTFGRTGCCLKIFKNIEPFNEKPWWGFSSKFKGSPLKEATFIQNVFASEGLAPRVYAGLVVSINKVKYWAHLTEDMGHCIPDQTRRDELFNEKIKPLAEEYGFEVFDDGRDWNMVGGKYVDFQGFYLKPDYKERLKKRLVGVANVGKWGPFMNYHNIPELEITGGRKNDHRVKEMKLEDISFEGKTVLDIGCSEGHFCRYAMNKGAKKVLGIDLEGVVKPTRELSYYLGYNNIDYLGLDLLKDIPEIGKFDIVFFLSMIQHIGLPDWVTEKTRELLVFEGNGKDRDAEGWSKLNNTFSHVEEVGKTTDLLERIVLWAKM